MNWIKCYLIVAGPERPLARFRHSACYERPARDGEANQVGKKRLCNLCADPEKENMCREFKVIHYENPPPGCIYDAIIEHEASKEKISSLGVKFVRKVPPVEFVRRISARFQTLLFYLKYVDQELGFAGSVTFLGGYLSNEVDMDFKTYENVIDDYSKLPIANPWKDGLFMEPDSSLLSSETSKNTLLSKKGVNDNG